MYRVSKQEEKLPYQHGGQSPEDVIDVSANMNFLGMPASVRKAALEGVERATRYPQQDNTDLIMALSEKWQMSPKQILVGNGAAELIYAIRGIQPKRALLFAPGFYEYEQALLACNCQILRYQLQREQCFEIQEDILKQISPDLDVMFLCNPNNPTGTLTDPVMLEKIRQECHKNQVLLVVDESFLDFVPNGESMAGKDGVLVIGSFTKMFCMPGIRLGYCISKDENLISKLKTQLQPWNLSTSAQLAGLAALQEDDFVKETQKQVTTERAWLMQQLIFIGAAHPEIAFYDGAANFIFFHAPNDFGQSCKEHGLWLRDCRNFPGLEAGWYRMVISDHKTNEQILEIFKQILER